MNNLSVFYQKSKTAAQGFSPQSKFAVDRREEFLELICLWSKKKVLTGMAVINALVYAVASKEDVLSMGVEGARHINKRNLNKLVVGGCRYLLTTIKGLSAYTKKYWTMAPSHRNAIRAIRDDLDMLGLIKAVPNHPGWEVQDVKIWSTFLDIDFAGLIVLYEMLEHHLLHYWFVNFDDLPEHKGALVKMLGDAASYLLGRRFGRKQNDDDTHPIEPLQTDIESTETTPEENLCQHQTLQDLTHSVTSLRSDTEECAALISTEGMSRWQDQ